MQRSIAARPRPATRRGVARRSALSLAAGLVMAASLLLVATSGGCTDGEPAGGGETPAEDGAAEQSLSASAVPTTTVSEARLMRERILILQGYIETHALEHFYVYPTIGAVREGGALKAPLWPADPWTGAAMRPGASPGHYTYSVANDRRSYRLVGHLPDGEFEVKGSMPDSALTAYRHREQEGLTLIRQYVVEWARQHDGLYPPARQVSREGGVGALRVGFWPSNPWNHGPMIQSSAVGDFSYEVAADRTSCRLALHTSPTSDWTLDCGPLDAGVTAD